jgi:hypothetical protein
VKWDAIRTVVRDVTFLAVGLGGIVYQQITHNVNLELLLVYTGLLGVQTGIAVKRLYPGRPDLPPTREPSSPSASPPSSTP